MAQAYASIILDAPIETVWDTIRDFNALPSWQPAIARSDIEDGNASDMVGCIRALQFQDGGRARERLLMLDDSRYMFSYNFETPAFPIENYVATVELIPVTNGDRTFAQWQASFDERPEDAGKFVDIISNAVFAAGWTALTERLKDRGAPSNAVRWQGLRPAKVFCSSVLRAPVAAVWAEMRDFAGMAGWHPDISDMHMLDGARSDQVAGVREFRFGEGLLHEQLTYLSDAEHAFRYKINLSSEPWLNYHAGARLYPISASGHCFATWTADWTASATDDVRLIPMVHNDVFQRAFDTLETKLLSR